MDDYDNFLRDLKERIQSAQKRAVLSVNQELVLLYWHIGRDILNRQQQQGWGAKVIDRLAVDLRLSFPEMKGFSRTNLLYMRAFAEAYPDEQIVQQLVGQIPWGHNIRILDSVKDASARLWYIQKTIENGWSRNILNLQIQSQLYNRQGKAITNFNATFGLILCASKDNVIAEYALRDVNKPIGIAEWQVGLTKSLPKELQTQLPTIEQLEAELDAVSVEIVDSE